MLLIWNRMHYQQMFLEPKLIVLLYNLIPPQAVEAPILIPTMASNVKELQPSPLMLDMKLF